MTKSSHLHPTLHPQSIQMYPFCSAFCDQLPTLDMKEVEDEGFQRCDWATAYPVRAPECPTMEACGPPNTLAMGQNKSVIGPVGPFWGKDLALHI